MEKKISMLGLAEVASAKPNQKHSKLRKYQVPDSDESVGRSNYYVKAHKAIRLHHKGESDVVDALMKDMLAEAAIETNKWKKAKLLNNHRAIVEYIRLFGRRNLVILPGKHFYYVFDELVVGAHPDLVAEENGQLVLIKLNLSKNDFAGGQCSLILHTLYEAARLQGISVAPGNVECLQTSSGSRVTGPQKGFPSKRVLNTACQEVLDLWRAA